MKNICKSYNNGVDFIIHDLNLEIYNGEIIVILGSSGCGKTTTLKMINKLITPDSGSIQIDDHSIEQYDPIILRRKIGYVFQSLGLFPHMSIADNISIVLKLEKIPYKSRMKRTYELLELMHLEPEIYAHRSIDELSGGQLQRIAVARALANHPNILLMDEPFAALDAITRNHLQQEVINLNQELKITIVFVTHDLHEALRIADRIVVINRGHIEQIGSKNEILLSPKTEFVKKLIDISGLSNQNLQ